MYAAPLLLKTIRGQLLQIRFARPTMYSWTGRDPVIPLSITSHPDTIFCHLAQNQLILLDWRLFTGTERLKELVH